MRRKTCTALLALIPAALVFTVAAAGTPKPVAPVLPLGTLLPSCYPDNEFTTFTDFGAFRLVSEGSGKGGGKTRLSWSLSVKVTGNLGSSLFARTPGSLQGRLDADIRVRGVAHTIHFTSHCIALGALIGGAVQANGHTEAVASFEGVVDLPPWNPGSQDAVAIIDINRPALEAKIGPEGLPTWPVSGATLWLFHGSTCNVTMTGLYGSKVSLVDPIGWLGYLLDGPGSFVRGRASLPADVTPQPHACKGIGF